MIIKIKYSSYTDKEGSIADVDFDHLVELIQKGAKKADIDNGAYIIFLDDIEIKSLENTVIEKYSYILEIKCGKNFKKLVSLFLAIANNGNSGHSFDYFVDDERFGFDGDGYDRIKEIYIGNDKILSGSEKFKKQFLENADYVLIGS
jgi:hypothetical protein